MGISFKRIKDKVIFANPFKAFSMDEIPLEIRFDPLTGQTARVMDIDYRPPARPDLDELARQSGEAPCPFCPDQIKKTTPLYPKGLVPEGRISRGEACLFPNLMPLDRYTGVCVISSAHYIGIEGFTPGILIDPFMASLRFIKTAAAYDREARYFSINWNYLPPSGSSMIHPHLQVNCGAIPTFMQRLQDEASGRYLFENGRDFWTDYIKAEKEGDERFIGDIGTTSWTLSFAPHSALPDICCIFPDRSSLLETGEEDMEFFVSGLVKAIGYFNREGLYSFNVSLFSGMESDRLRVNARIAPRLLLHKTGNSDQNYLQFLHHEHLCLKAPESVRGAVLEAFGGLQ